jgi:hypothetical protein
LGTAVYEALQEISDAALCTASTNNVAKAKRSRDAGDVCSMVLYWAVHFGEQHPSAANQMLQHYDEVAAATGQRRFASAAELINARQPH